MTKTVIDIDDHLLAQAMNALGTRTIKDTVHEALAQIVRGDAFESAVEFAREGGFADALNPQVMGGAWRHT